MAFIPAALGAIGGGSVATGAAVAATGVAAGSALLDNKNAKSSIKKMDEQRERSQEFIERMQSQARNDLFKLFPAGQESRQKGLQSSLDLYKQAVPMQANMFKQGNMAAQNFLSQGLPQIQNAILGRPVNTNFQPVGLTPPGNFNVSLPQFTPMREVLGDQQGAAPGTTY